MSLPVSCSLVVTRWERVDLLALLYVMFSFVTFPFGVLGQVWYLIVLIPDLSLLSYFAGLFLMRTYFDSKYILAAMLRGCITFSPFVCPGLLVYDISVIGICERLARKYGTKQTIFT